MSAILNSLNAHYFLIFQPILMKLVSKFKFYRALSDKTYLLLGLRSPLKIGNLFSTTLAMLDIPMSGSVFCCFLSRVSGCRLP